MAFTCTYSGIPYDDANRLTPEMLTLKASELGLEAAYVVVAIEIQRRRWRRGLADIIVHLGYGENVLHPQFPDEAKRAITAAVDALLRQR